MKLPRLRYFLFCFLLSFLAAKSTSVAKTPPYGIYPFVFGNYLYFPFVLTSGDSVNLIFDSGADRLYLDSLRFQYSGYSGSRKMPALIGGAGNSGHTKIGLCLDSIGCFHGSLGLEQPTTPILPLRNICGRYADGIVGLSLIRPYTCLFDFANEKLHILEPDDFSRQGYRKIPILVKNNRCYLELTLSVAGKKIKGMFLIDTGHPGSININSQTAREYGLAQSAFPKRTFRFASGGLGGASTSYLCRSDSICIGNFVLHRLGIRYSGDKYGALSHNEQYIGLVGTGLLKYFDMVFAFAESAAYLRPNRNFPFHTFGTEIDFSWSGITFTDRTDIGPGWIVNGLAAYSPAAKAGLKPGDIIVTINGIPVTALKGDKIQNAFLDRIGRKISMDVIRNGKRFPILLRYKDIVPACLL